MDNVENLGGSSLLVWTNSMSTMMLTHLVDLVASGTRTSSGFKKVHLNNCAKVLNDHFKLAITGDQVSNHLKKWRKIWAKIEKLKKISGALWDEETCTIRLEHEQYTGHIKDHKGDANYLNTPIEHYHEMATIFVASMATGKYAKSGNDPLSVEVHDIEDDEGGNGSSEFNMSAIANVGESSAGSKRAAKRAKISLKILSMETKTQEAPGNAQVTPNQNNSGPASVDSTAQAGHAGAGDSQEEIYQMVTHERAPQNKEMKSLKDQYFAELSELYNKISVKIQHVDSMIPPQRPSEQYERMKSFKIMLERILQILQFNKSNIQPALRDKIPQYEKQIISILNSQRRRPVQQTQGQQQFQPPAGQAPSSNISQQQQPSQSLQQHDSHTNPQANLSSMSTGLQSSGAAGIQLAPDFAAACSFW